MLASCVKHLLLDCGGSMDTTLRDSAMLEKLNELLLVLQEIQRQQNMIGAHLAKLVTLAEKQGGR